MFKIGDIVKITEKIRKGLDYWGQHYFAYKPLTVYDIRPRDLNGSEMIFYCKDECGLTFSFPKDYIEFETLN